PPSAPAAPPAAPPSLHDARPICAARVDHEGPHFRTAALGAQMPLAPVHGGRTDLVAGEDAGAGRARRKAEHHQVVALVLVEAGRSEEHTSELQSRENLVCRLLLG